MELKWTKNALHKRKMHWVSREDVEKCLAEGKKKRSKPKHTGQSATWLAFYDKVAVRYVKSLDALTVVDVFRKATA